MKITELIDRLQQIHAEHGDIRVFHDLDVGDDTVPVERVDVVPKDDLDEPTWPDIAVILC